MTLRRCCFPRRSRRAAAGFINKVCRAAARRADLVITGTQAAADEITGLTAIDAERIRVVPYGVDSLVVAPESIAAVRARLGLGQRRFVLWVGSLEPRKAVGTLVAAMAQVLREGAAPDVDLVLAGFEGWRNQGLIGPALVAELGTRLTHVGRLPDAELAALYAAADVFALPSRHEGFGLPALEAMAQGTAVVCSDIPALREVAGDAAVFAPVGDVDAWAQALAALLVDEARRGLLGDAGRRRAEGFSWPKMIQRTRTVYNEAAGGGAG